MEYTDIIYLAGMVDGDGSISITKQQYNERRCRHNLSLSVTNCSKELVDWIRERWEGHVYSKLPTVKGRPIYRWAVTNQAAENIIEELVDYLIVKKTQANIALDLRATYGKITYRQGGVSANTIELREAMRETMSKLNKGESII